MGDRAPVTIERGATAQRTLAGGFACEGIGLHTGRSVRVRVLPGDGDTGRVFVRTDLTNQPEIQAILANVTAAERATTLGAHGASVGTVEHLLAALAGCGVDNARIELDGPELPLLDGSARPWTDALRAVGTIAQGPFRRAFVLTETVTVRAGDGWITAAPSDRTTLDYEIVFERSPIGTQRFALTLTDDDFVRELAGARTFAQAREIEAMRAAGLIRGGSLEGAIVCDEARWLNPPLRFDDEPVRHKLVDLVGDLSLLGALPRAKITAHRAGHALHHRLARALYDFASGCALS